MRHDFSLPFFEPDHEAEWKRVDALAPSFAFHGSDVLEGGRAALAKLASTGLLGALLPVRFGGWHAEVRARSLCLVREALAGHAALADSVFAVQGLGMQPLLLGGSPELQEELLAGAVQGDRCFAFALSEPEAGSDAAALRTVAQREEDSWLLTGTKRWISNAGLATHAVVFARTGEGPKGITAFLVDLAQKGVTVGAQVPLLSPHPLAELHLDGVRIPDARRLGPVGGGLALALKTLDLFRPSVGAAALGMARVAQQAALAHVKERQQFGAPLAELQGIQFALAESEARWEAGWLLVLRAAWAKDQGRRTPREAALAKLVATEGAQAIVDTALQLHGASGVVTGSTVERLYRDVRALRIYEGASEVQRQLIARAALED